MVKEPSSIPNVDLRELFAALQGKLAATLRANQAAFDHPGARGETAELDWVSMLGDYLPRRYQASKAFVVDADGHRSEAIDLVIYDRQYCPFLFTSHGNHYVPAESVYAVFEVKQTLTKEHVEYAAAKAASVRRLRRTSAPIPHAAGTYEPRLLFDIIAGVLALESSWTPPFGDPLIATLSAMPAHGRLDLGCALQHGSFEVNYGAASGVELVKATDAMALMHFFLTLLRRLQMLATVPAIDLAQYGRALDEER